MTFRSIRVKKHLQFNFGRTAQGTETRPNLKSKEPHTSLASQSKSKQYIDIRAAAKGSEAAHRDLIVMLALEVERHCTAKNWKIKDKSREMALIALEPYTSEVLLSQQAEADILGISKSAYRETWITRSDFFKDIVKRWSS